jgi:hypothetical protein
MHLHPRVVICNAGCRTVSPAESFRYTLSAPHAGHAADTCLTDCGLSGATIFAAHDFTLPAISSTVAV